MDSYGLLIDFNACIGCKACMKACKEANNLPGPPGEKLSYADYTVVIQHGEVFYRQMCMHCQTPTCASVCPVGALVKSPEGPVTYDGSKCIGCRYCMVACPFNIPKYEWNKAVPVVRKCIMCDFRLREGKEPACAWVCPMGATRFGPRNRLLDVARGRIFRHPDQYINHIYGEQEVGGTSVLMIGPVPFSEIGLRTPLPNEPLPNLTWTILRKIPNIVFTGGIVVGGVWWVINRRMELERTNGHKKEDDSAK